MRAFVLVSAIWFVATVSAVAQAQSCAPAKRAATEAKTTRAKLLKVKSDWMGMGTALPEHSEEILRLKDELARVIDAQVECASAGSSVLDPDHLQGTLVSMLDANKPEPPVKPITGDEPEMVDGVLGASLKVTAKHPNGVASLVAVEARFGIECGYDTVLLVYERSALQWRRVLRWQRGRYDNPGEAFGDFFTYAVLPDSGGTGNWRMVVAHGRPWCTSRFSEFEVDLLQPRRGEAEQRAVWHYQEGYSRFENEPHVEAERHEFELRLSITSIDPAIYALPGIFRFRVHGDHVERAQPVATNGRDFVDVWLQIGWDDAKRWSDPASLIELKTLHERFAASYNDVKDGSTYHYGQVLACSDTQHFQVEIDSDPGKAIYYQIRQEQNGFTMLSASGKSDVRCGGHDLMAKQ